MKVLIPFYRCPVCKTAADEMVEIVRIVLGALWLQAGGDDFLKQKILPAILFDDVQGVRQIVIDVPDPVGEIDRRQVVGPVADLHNAESTVDDRCQRIENQLGTVLFTMVKVRRFGLSVYCGECQADEDECAYF